MPASVLSEPTDITRLPTQDELPCDDGEPMETARHRQQMILRSTGATSVIRGELGPFARRASNPGDPECRYRGSLDFFFVPL